MYNLLSSIGEKFRLMYHNPEKSMDWQISCQYHTLYKNHSWQTRKVDCKNAILFLLSADKYSPTFPLCFLAKL